MLTVREFLGEEVYKACIQDKQELERFRNEVARRRPTETEKIILKINKERILNEN